MNLILSPWRRHIPVLWLLVLAQTLLGCTFRPRMEKEWHEGLRFVVVRPLGEAAAGILPPGEGEAFRARLIAMAGENPRLKAVDAPPSNLANMAIMQGEFQHISTEYTDMSRFLGLRVDVVLVFSVLQGGKEAPVFEKKIRYSQQKLYPKGPALPAPEQEVRLALKELAENAFRAVFARQRQWEEVAWAEPQGGEGQTPGENPLFQLGLEHAREGRIARAESQFNTLLYNPDQRVGWDAVIPFFFGEPKRENPGTVAEGEVEYFRVTERTLALLREKRFFLVATSLAVMKGEPKRESEAFRERLHEVFPQGIPEEARIFAFSRVSEDSFFAWRGAAHANLAKISLLHHEPDAATYHMAWAFKNYPIKAYGEAFRKILATRKLFLPELPDYTETNFFLQIGPPLSVGILPGVIEKRLLSIPLL